MYSAVVYTLLADEPDNKRSSQYELKASEKRNHVKVRILILISMLYLYYNLIYLLQPNLLITT